DELARKRWNDLMREAAKVREPAGVVEQHVFHAHVAQGLELGTDLVRRAVERPALSGLARINKVWTLRQALRPQTPRHACLDRLLVLSRGRGDGEGAGQPDAHRIKGATARLHL